MKYLDPYLKKVGDLFRSAAGNISELSSRPLKSARVKLTALYVLHTFIILAVFMTLLGYARLQHLRENLTGKFANPAEENIVIGNIWTDLQTTTAILAIYVLLAIAVLSYFSVQLTLKPINVFIEAHRRFIADASHELRTPLATMRTEIEVALLDPHSIPKEELIQLLRSNVDEIDRMSKILTNLLNLAAFNDAGGGPMFAPVDLADIARHTLERIRTIAIAKKVDIKEDIVHAEVSGNAVALEEVIFNLLKNAVHYSNPEGYVALSLATEGSHAILIIEDNGIGISPEDLPHVFEPFYRGERSLHMYTAGSGLGLPLAKEIVRRHKGTIHIDSAPKKGTVITVKLPLARNGG